MSNIEKIRQMSEKELIKLFDDIRKDSLYSYRDIEAWLKSDAKTAALKGEKGIYTSSKGEERPCTIVNKGTVYGKPYCSFVEDGASIMRSVPATSVKKK